MPQPGSRYKWYMLALTALTGTLVVAIPFSCMPSLFKEISEDLGLNLIQIGTIWGMASMAGLFVSIAAGVLGDKFGIKVIIIICSLLAGVAGALRGISTSFVTLIITVFSHGIARMILPVLLTKEVGVWFQGNKMGMAMGISAVGMGLGLMLGPMLSATYLSPLLGGWRGVMYLFGGINIIVGLVWLFTGREHPDNGSAVGSALTIPVKEAISSLLKNRALWLVGITLLFRVASIMGMLGYMPLYLRDRGWMPASADNTLTAFYAVSTLCVVPLSSLSDKIGLRKVILFPTLIVSTICIFLIPHADGAAMWALMILSGMFFDGFMATLVTMLIETRGVGVKYSGTAIGIIFTIAQIGNVASPPLGNSFASINPGLPFVFWGILSAIALVMMFFCHETGQRRSKLQVYNNDGVIG